MKLKKSRDVNEHAKSIVDLAKVETKESVIEDTRNPHAVELERLGGLKCGKARAKALSASQRSKIAHAGTRARWSEHPHAA